MASPEAERRRDKRLELRLPVKFAPKPDNSLSLVNGVTRNVSSGGVYFEAPAGQVGPSSSLWVRIGVRARQDEVKPNLTLVGTGTVCRVEKLGPNQIDGTWPESQLDVGICGIALQFEHRPTIQLHSLEELLWEEQ